MEMGYEVLHGMFLPLGICPLSTPLPLSSFRDRNKQQSRNTKAEFQETESPHISLGPWPCIHDNIGCESHYRKNKTESVSRRLCVANLMRFVQLKRCKKGFPSMYIL